MATWYLDTGVGRVHKSKRCAEKTAQSTGGKNPLYKTVSSKDRPGWRSCSRCINKITKANSGLEEEEEEIQM